MNWFTKLWNFLTGKKPSASTSPAPQLTEKAHPILKETASRKISKDGLELIKEFEGLYLKAYKDPVGVWTIGYGHTGVKHRDGSVKSGLTITKQQAEKMLETDLSTKYSPDVNKLVKVPLLQREFDALVSFHFNTGALGRSTLLKKLNAGDKSGAAKEFPRWNKAGGKVLRGLTRRRSAEKALFLGQDWKQF